MTGGAGGGGGGGGGGGFLPPLFESYTLSQIKRALEMVICYLENQLFLCSEALLVRL